MGDYIGSAYPNWFGLGVVLVAVLVAAIGSLIAGRIADAWHSRGVDRRASKRLDAMSRNDARQYHRRRAA